MAASDEIKDAIVGYFDCTNVKGTKKSDWKRVQKRILASGAELREFHNAKVNRTVYTIGDDEDASILEKDQWVYGFCDPEEDSLTGDGYCLVFEPLDRFLRCGHIYDQHQGYILDELYGLPQGKFDEVCENQFVVSKTDFNDLTIHIYLKKLGFKFSKELTEFLMAHKAPTTASSGPDLSIVPPVLDPNYSAPLQPASTPTTSTITRFTNKNPGQVFAAQQAQIQQQQAGMMAAIGQMAAQLGATGGVTIGSTHIPAAPLAPGMRPLAGVAPLPPSGIFNSPGMQNAMPGMASPYPELANLQPAVQAAFIAARVMGKTGLEQENTNWADGDTLAQALNNGNFLSVERSNLIWALYEFMDDGSGTPLEDYFTLDDELLHETFCEVFDIDEPEDLEVIDDTQTYSPPYDLPVPQPQPFNPIAGLGAGLGGLIPPAPGGHGGPQVPRGPAGMAARAGSFTPPPAPPAAVAPPPPPPGNAKAHVNADSGDKWAEFCGEVWGFYEANKANLPLDLDWYDRYRPREAQITGLGYEFIRREFTGVMVKMGYLDRDGKLIETIDLPSAVLDELLKEWGGDWNIDDITQMINKRKGENPETGFSYTSEQLWDEVKSFLDGEGWKEAA